MQRRSFLIGMAAACGALAFRPSGSRKIPPHKTTTTSATTAPSTTAPSSTDVYTATYMASY